MVVIGNLTVGGAGKTPCVIALVKYLKAKGERVVVISRGYGCSVTTFPHKVIRKNTAQEVGDEPYLIFLKTNVPVVIDPKRTRALDFAVRNLSATLVISDDGLQHYHLKRDCEVVVVDGERRYGNGHMLPAGPLREPLSRLNTIDMELVNGRPWQKKQYQMCLDNYQIYPLQQPEKKMVLASFLAHDGAGKKIAAIAGIAHPQRFFKALQSWGCQLVAKVEFPDHHAFTWQNFTSEAFDEADYILMTEKDMVKCLSIDDKRLYVVSVEAQLESAFFERFEKMRQIWSKAYGQKVT